MEASQTWRLDDGGELLSLFGGGPTASSLSSANNFRGAGMTRKAFDHVLDNAADTHVGRAIGLDSLARNKTFRSALSLATVAAVCGGVPAAIEGVQMAADEVIKKAKGKEKEKLLKGMDRTEEELMAEDTPTMGVMPTPKPKGM